MRIDEVDLVLIGRPEPKGLGILGTRDALPAEKLLRDQPFDPFGLHLRLERIEFADVRHPVRAERKSHGQVYEMELRGSSLKRNTSISIPLKRRNDCQEIGELLDVLSGDRIIGEAGFARELQIPRP